MAAPTTGVVEVQSHRQELLGKPRRRHGHSWPCRQGEHKENADDTLRGRSRDRRDRADRLHQELRECRSWLAGGGVRVQGHRRRGPRTVSRSTGYTSFTLDTNDEVDIARGVGKRRSHLLQPHRLRRWCAAIGVDPPGSDGPGHRRRPSTWSAIRALNGRSGQRYSQGVSGNIVTSRSGPLELVHALGADDAGLLGGHVHPALHARLPAAKAEDLAEVAHRHPKPRRREQPRRLLPRAPALAGRLHEAPAGLRSLCGSTTAARRPTAAVPWC